MGIPALWCGCTRGGLGPLAGLLLAGFATSSLYPQPSEHCRRRASTGLVLATVLLPSLFAAEAASVEAIGVAFRLTWWCGLAADVIRLLELASQPPSGRARHAAGAACGLALMAGLLSWCTTTAGVACEAQLLPAVLFFVLCVLALQRAMPQSFTFGEAVLVAELCAVLLHFIVFAVVLEFTSVPVLRSQLRKIIIIGLFSAVVISALNMLLAQMLLSSPARGLQQLRGGIHIAATVAMVAGMLQWMSSSIEQNSLEWLWDYVTSHTATPLKFIMYYVAVLVPALALAPDARESALSQVVVRKYFHILALVMFVPTILLNVRFMALAFAVALAIFVVLESLRICDVPPVVAVMNPFMQSYVDDRDEGRAVLTHIYLLLGCALPVFFNYFVLRGIFSASGLLIALSGVTVTGLGDAMASYCGIRFGRHRWRNSRKTLEGSAAMLLVVLAFQVGCLWAVGFHHLSAASWARLVLADALVALLEAKTDQIDNLFLPLYHVALLQLV